MSKICVAFAESCKERLMGDKTACPWEMYGSYDWMFEMS